MGEHLAEVPRGAHHRPRPADPAPAAGPRGGAGGALGSGRLHRPHGRARGRRGRLGARRARAVRPGRAHADGLAARRAARIRDESPPLFLLWGGDRAPRGRDGPRRAPRGVCAGARCTTSATWRPSGTSRAHTVRAYLGDVTGLLDHATRLGHADVAELDLRSLRSWLAKQQTLGLSRTTLARRATAARVFTAWLHRTGRVPRDAGATLGAPKAHRTLPPVLRADEAERPDPRGRGPRRRRQPGGAARRGDAGAALCHRDPGRRAGRARRRRRRPRAQRGAGARQGPQGAHGAVRAPGRAGARRAGWPTAGPRCTPTARARRCSSALAGDGSTSARCARSCTAGSPRCRARPTSGRTGCVTPRPPTCSRAAPTCARSRSSSGTPRWRRRSSTPTSRPTGCERPTGRPTRGLTTCAGATDAPRAGATGCVAPQRQQPDRPGAHQAQRVEVGLALDPAPVQAGAREAVRAGQLEGADLRAARPPACRRRRSPRRARRSCGWSRGRRPPPRARRATRRSSPCRAARPGPAVPPRRAGRRRGVPRRRASRAGRTRGPPPAPAAAARPPRGRAERRRGRASSAATASRRAVRGAMRITLTAGPDRRPARRRASPVDDAPVGRLWTIRRTVRGRRLLLTAQPSGADFARMQTATGALVGPDHPRATTLGPDEVGSGRAQASGRPAPADA